MSGTLLLTGEQRKTLREGILGAYPNAEDLQMLLSEQLDVQLGVITRGDAYRAKVFSLIQDFQAEGRLEELIRLIVSDKPNSPYLEAIKNEFSGILREDTPERKTYSRPQEEKMENPTRSLTPAQRLELRKTLRALIVSDLNDLIDALQVPKGIIPPDSADAASRVDALWGWADSPTGCGLTNLQETLKVIVPPP